MKWRTTLIVLVAVAAVVAVLLPWVVTGRPALEGPADGSTVRTEALRSVVASGRDVELLVDDRPVPTHREGDRIRLAETVLPDGEHTITARVSGGLLPDRESSRRVVVDGTAPNVSLDLPAVTDLRAPYTVRGKASGADRVDVGDQSAPVSDDGSFSLTLKGAPATVQVRSTDSAGNEAKREAPVPVRHPGMRGVHMTALAWASPALREPVLQMARDKRIDTVELDIKDESGEVGYRSEVGLANQIGAVRGYYSAPEAIKQLHDMGVRVVGRIVAFRDPVLARASWDGGARDRVVQTAQGTPWAGSYGQYAFTNFAHPDVVAYNIDLAAEAAKLGFDDILYDYVRRPEGALDRMRLAGLAGTPEQAIASFLARAREAVRPHGAFLGASVFGIAVNRPAAIAQDIPSMSRNVDYIAPMVYPSHWGPGEYGVADPNGQPYDITQRSVAAFVDKSRDSGAVIIPWLQAFSLGRAYGPAEVGAQIKAAKDAGASSFLLWNAACRYDHAGL